MRHDEFRVVFLQEHIPFLVCHIIGMMPIRQTVEITHQRSVCSNISIPVVQFLIERNHFLPIFCHFSGTLQFFFSHTNNLLKLNDRNE